MDQDSEDKPPSSGLCSQGMQYLSAFCFQKQDQDTPSQYFYWMLFKQNAFITVGYFLLFLAFGMCIGFLGPTLEDMACFTKGDVSDIAWAFFAQTSSMVVGIFVGGVVSKRWVFFAYV